VNWWLDARKRVPKPRHQAFDSLVFLVTRQLWLEHNGRVFRGGGDLAIANPSGACLGYFRVMESGRFSMLVTASHNVISRV
jgi:hypothetical protein